MKVSVLCTAYNHEKYIEECLQSLVNQSTSFDYEVIIHDDASTDCTKRIIENYAKQYPSLLKPIYEDVNQYSLGKSSLDICFAKSEGEYIAICEGDDFWTDKMKLQLQVEQLERNPSINLCFHRGFVLNNDNGVYYRRIGDYGSSFHIIPDDVLIPLGGQSMATNSILIRRTAYERKIRFYQEYSGKKTVGDFIIQTIGAENGAIYIPRDMCAHRTNVIGSWVDRQSKAGWEKEISFKQNMLYIYDALNLFLDSKFSIAFRKRKMKDCEEVLFNTSIPRKEKTSFIIRNNLLEGKILLLLPIGLCRPVVAMLKGIRKKLRKVKYEQ